jgi:hypothetical protein
VCRRLNKLSRALGYDPLDSAATFNAERVTDYAHEIQKNDLAKEATPPPGPR